MGHTQSIMSAPTASSPIRALIMLALVVTAHGAGFGRRASFLTTTSGSFTLSGGSSRAGNDESLDLARDLGESLDDAPEHKDKGAASQHPIGDMVLLKKHIMQAAHKLGVDKTKAAALVHKGTQGYLTELGEGRPASLSHSKAVQATAVVKSVADALKGKGKHNPARCTSPLLPGLEGGMHK